MKVEFLRSIHNFKDYKGFNLPEFAFAGRSNVGKSSLINCLLNTKIAHTSKTPGKTRAINFFSVDGRYILADLPGYGYAKVSKDEMLKWKDLIEAYISHSKRLKTVFILVDILRGLEEEERMLIDWLNYLKKPSKIVFTKIDKLSKNELRKKIDELSDITPLFFSSKTKEGKKEILKLIETSMDLA